MQNLPALILGFVLLAYWGRVIRLTIKARRRTGRAGNFIPRERIGRWLRIIWNPVVAIWIIVPFVTALVSRLPWGLRPLSWYPAVAWIGVILAIIAFVATVICWRKMGKSWRMGIDPGEKTTLVLTGPFAYVRHPIYALSSLLMISSLLVVPSPPMFVVAVLHLLLLQWEARREERYLTTVHGDVYARYAARTGRFLPVSLTPYRPDQ